MEYSSAKKKAAAYCAFQERCHHEVETKLMAWGTTEEVMMETIMWLRDEKYLDEERFARSYVRGKFNRNQWGKYKILQGLKQKHIDGKLAQLALTEIKDEDYYQTILNLARKKVQSLSNKDLQKSVLKMKCVQYLAGKGFESELCWNAAEDVLFEIDSE